MRHYFSALLLSAALLAPLAVKAADDEHRDRNDHRMYDRTNKDYHEWNDREDQTYRRYLQEQHKHYRDFSKASRRDQENYWKWRHSHSDDDRR